MARAAVMLALLFFIGACGASSSIPPTATATPAPTTVAPTPEPTPELTPTPVPGTGNCPIDRVLSVQQFSNADPECFGNHELQIQGWLDKPPGMGFEGPEIEPGWVFYPADGLPSLWTGKPVDPDHVCPAAPLDCGWFFLHIDPASGLDLDISPREIVVTGHLDDPAAATCHYVYPDDWPDPTAADATEAIERCRGQFVVDSYVEAP